MSTTQQLTPTEAKVLDVLPASAEEISSEFGTTRSTARDHIGSIQTKVTLDFERGDNGEKIYEHVPSREEGREADPDQNRSKQAITKEATQHVLGLEERMDSLLEGSSSPDVSGLANKDGREDVAIHRTDDHIGDVVKNEFGEEIFNTEIAKRRIRKVTEKTLYLVDRQKAAGYDFDTAHLILGGDNAIL
jgi:hypothetical protein